MSILTDLDHWPRMNTVSLRVTNVGRSYSRGSITTGTLTGYLQTDAGVEIEDSRVTASPSSGAWILDFPPLPLSGDLRIWMVVFLGTEGTPTFRARRHYPVDDWAG